MWGTFTQPCEEGIDIFYTHNTVNCESCTGQSKIHQITSTTQSLIPCPWDMSVWSLKRKVKRKRCMSQQGKTRKASLMSHHPLIGRWAQSVPISTQKHLLRQAHGLSKYYCKVNKAMCSCCFENKQWSSASGLCSPNVRLNTGCIVYFACLSVWNYLGKRGGKFLRVGSQHKLHSDQLHTLVIEHFKLIALASQHRGPQLPCPQLTPIWLC